MEKRGPTPGSGSYGKACMQCSKAKSRCVARPDSVGCERCLRLKKQCQPSDSTRRRTLRNLESGAHIAKLEGRIDTLTTMLESITNATGLTSTDIQHNPEESEVSTGLRSTGDIGNSINSDNDAVAPSLTDAPSHSSPYRTGGTSRSPQPLGDLAPEDAAWYLDRFKNHMLPCFPFICISPDITAQQLLQDRPFLAEAIIAVATPSTQEKQARADTLKYNLTKSAVLENQSSIDMLLSILTYIAWSTDPFFQRASNLSRMIMLAMSLVYDLQLDKPAPPPPDTQFIAKMAPGLRNAEQVSSNSSAQGILEQQRAVLACFVLSSIISSSFGRIVPLQWDSQMEKAVIALEVNKGSPSDESFAIQVRLQALTQRALHVRKPQDADNAGATEAPTTTFATSMYLKVLKGQLEELRASISPHLPRQDMLTAHAHYVELCINEVTRLASSEAPLLPTSGSSSRTMAGCEPLESLWRSLHAVKSWLDVFYTIPPAAYVGFPFFIWFQLVRCLVILKHLSTFDDPAWDCQAVRNTVDMLTLLEWMAEKAELASREAEERSDDDVFRRVGKMLRLSQKWVAEKQQRAAAEGSPLIYNDGPGLVPIGDDMIDMTEMAWMDALESGSGTWLEEVLGWSPMAL
ncbi:C6 transcription factor [Aspergillus heteromorphus CBS 117.55]|uniref:C6 transcription factor n=1 Tax=Aspergillus heteromorphus CBS 117.55 TaxID=1448321 RepID=A0A317VKG8_9EURO|nr:C6 transcription factor [Aspergillus heteromorphus CBS 117.55]PWY74395.1 C6 transcription factor [Aspergillus heteromorphus CBS 117.55]